MSTGTKGEGTHNDKDTDRGFMMAQPIWRGRLSDATKRMSSGVPRDTLELRRPGAGFTLKANWPGLVFIVLGSILLLVWASLWSPYGMLTLPE
jgi:hypothetical protein